MPRTMVLKPEWIMCGAVFTAALALRLLVLWQVSGDPRIDEIPAGSGAGDSVFYQPPLYPYFLAILKRAANGNWTAVRGIQAVIGAAGCVMLAMAAKRMLGLAGGWLAGLLLAVYPASVSYDLQIDKTVLDMSLMCALLLALTMARGDLRARRWLLCGAVCGLLALSIENALALGFVIALAPIVEHRRQGIRAMLAFVGGLLLAIAPAVLANRSISGEGQRVTAHFASDIHIGNRLGTRLALVFADEPVAVAQAHHQFVGFSPLLHWLEKSLSFRIVLTAAGAGLVLGYARRRSLAIVLAMILVYAATLAAFFVDERSRLPLLPMLAILAAAVAAPAPRRSPPWVAGSLLAATVMFGASSLANRAMPQRLRGSNDYNRAVALEAAARTSNAELHYRLAIQKNPHLAAAYNNLGVIRSRGDNAAEAEHLFTQAIELEPNNPSAHAHLGMLLLQSGALDRAIDKLREAMRLEPSNRIVKYNLAVALQQTGRLEEAAPLLHAIVSEADDDLSRQSRERLGAMPANPP